MQFHQEISKQKSKTPNKYVPVLRQNQITSTPYNRNYIKCDFSAKKANTFSTPNKVQNLNFKNLNNTDLKTSCQSNTKQNHHNYEPFMLYDNSKNDTIDSRTSIASLMNVSTSTIIEAPLTTSYSPIVRKCLSEFELTMENKINNMFESLKMYTKSDTIKTNTLSNNELGTPEKQNLTIKENNMPWSSIKHELKHIVREELASFTQNKPKNLETEFSRPIDQLQNTKCNTFESKSFKVPAPLSDDEHVTFVPNEENISYTNILQNDSQFLSSSVTSSIRTEDTLAPTDLVIFPETTILENRSRQLRRSVRLATITVDTFTHPNLNTPDRTISVSKSRPLRRSLRLSILSVNAQTNEKVKLGRSSKIEMKQKNLTKVDENELSTKKFKSKNIPTKNKVIASYFSNTKNTNLKNSKAAHQKAVLEMLNNGTFKELQILPHIGLKTAYQIITHRTLNGKFKNFEAVSVLPVWRGKSWERFKEANNI